MNDQSIEEISQTKGLNAPRVTLPDFNANIVDTEILKHVSKSGKVLRWAILTTRSGFAVTGRPSVAVSAENDDASIGEQVALDNARNELWGLMGYALAERLAFKPIYAVNPTPLTDEDLQKALTSAPGPILTHDAAAEHVTLINGGDQ